MGAGVDSPGAGRGLMTGPLCGPSVHGRGHAIMSRKLLGLCVVVLLPALLTAAEPPEKLIEQLGSARHKDRQQAAAALLDRGTAVIPLLEKACASNDRETRRQAEALLETLRPRAEAEQVLAAQKIKLTFKDVHGTDAVRDFARQARLPLAMDALERVRLVRKRIT